jgi:hypothetical protein
MDKVAGGRKRPALVNISESKTVSAQARVTYSGPDAAKHISRLALIVGSPVSRVIGNFYLGLNKPAFPARLFTSEPSAEQWLRET